MPGYRVPSPCSHGYVVNQGGAKVELNISSLVTYGAEGVIFKGTTLDDREVALKCRKRRGFLKSALRKLTPLVQLPKTTGIPDYLIKSEIEALQKVQSTFIVQVLGTKDYFFYSWLSMEYCIARVSQALEPIKSYPERNIVLFHLFTPILSALQEIHSRGFVHRDVKQDNILLTSKGIPKLCDFGFVVKIGSELYKRSVRPGVLIGTSFYIAPEIIQGKGFDGRADIYSFAVTLMSVSYQAPVEELFRREKEVISDDLFRHLTKLLREDSWRTIGDFSSRLQEYNLFNKRRQSKHWSKASDTIFGMLSVDPDKRPTAAEALASNMFADAMDGWNAYFRGDKPSGRFRFSRRQIGELFVNTEMDKALINTPLPSSLKL